MKINLKIALLFLGLICLGAAVDPCTNYTNETDNACVDKCAPPLITLEADKKCIQPSSCKTFFDRHALACVDKCPENFEGITVDKQPFQVCAPCFFKDDKGNCFEQCPEPLISDATTKKCIKSPQDCKGYFIQEHKLCTPECPFRLVASKLENQNICVPCEKLNQCGTVDLNSCKQMLSSDKLRCGRDCPPSEIAKAKVQNQNYIQCEKCPADKQFLSNDGTTCIAACTEKQIIDKQSMRCIESMQCDRFVIAGEDKLQYCVDQCPPDQSPTPVENQKFQTCTKCEGKNVFDPITKKCAETCTITLTTTDGKVRCLRAIFECDQFISADQTKCLPKCEDKQLLRPTEIPKQFICTAACEDNEFKILNEKEKIDMCVKVCPGDTYADTDKKACTKTDQCKANLSMDGKQCLEQCPPGQVPNPTEKKCKPCPGKVSADGKTCGKACATGEYFDVDEQICVAADKCKGKLINENEKVCSTNCRPGEFLFTGADKVQKCLKKPEECASYISSDGKQCVGACADDEVSIAKEGVNICIRCPFGATDDKSKCKTNCATIFDADTRKCTDVCTKFKSVDNKVCSSKCIPPEVSKDGNTTQCFSACEADQVLTKEGCIAKASCTGYISSNGAACVPSCLAVMEVENADKTCSRCTDTQVPILVAQDGSKKVSCVDKSDSNSTDAKQRAQTLQDAFKDQDQFTNEQKGQVKDEIKKLRDDVQAGITETKANNALATTEQKQKIKDLLENLKAVAKMFQDKIKDTNSDLSSDDDNKLALLSSDFNLISEKKKFGFAFLTKFKASDFKSTLTAPSLQVDVTQKDISNVSNTITTINSLQVTHSAVNPNCADDNVCGTSGLFSVLASGNVARMLQQANQQTYQTVFASSADKIAKTVCVSYDSNGLMSLAVSTTADKTSNEITCSFYENAALYYDSTCQYIDTTLCNTGNNNQTTTEVTYSAHHIFSLIALLFFIAI